LMKAIIRLNSQTTINLLLNFKRRNSKNSLSLNSKNSSTITTSSTIITTQEKSRPSTTALRLRRRATSFPISATISKKHNRTTSNLLRGLSPRRRSPFGRKRQLRTTTRSAEATSLPTYPRLSMSHSITWTSNRAQSTISTGTTLCSPTNSLTSQKKQS
jgi:hypothetical protein